MSRKAENLDDLFSTLSVSPAARERTSTVVGACCWGGWPIDLSRGRLDSLPPLFMLVHFSEGRERERGMPRYGESDESSVERSLNVPSREWTGFALISLVLFTKLRFRNHMISVWLWTPRVSFYAGQWKQSQTFSNIQIPNFLMSFLYGLVVVVVRASRDFFFSLVLLLRLQCGSLSHGQTTSRTTFAAPTFLMFWLPGANFSFWFISFFPI